MGALMSGSSEAGRRAHDRGQHVHSPGHAAHRDVGNTVTHEADTSSPRGVPHPPTQCILVIGCGAAVAGAAVIAMDVAPHVVGRVEADVVQAPDSPALGLEPPPPRA